MNIDQVHNPARLDGESQREYRYRQGLSKRLATATRPVWNNGTYFKAGTVSPQRGAAERDRIRARQERIRAEAIQVEAPK